MGGRTRKAVVLAAGFGTRLRPFTLLTPKPLMPVWGVPMLERIVATLRERGVDDIAVNCHHLHGQIEEWCAANGCKAIYEPEILGTGGVLNPLREWIGGESFYLANGDIVIENAPELELSGDEAEIGVALATEYGPRTIEVEPVSGFVTNWKSDVAGDAGTFTYCGFALLRPEILDYVEKDGFSSIVDAYGKAAADGRFVRAVAPAGMLWTDAGTIGDYIEINRADGGNAFADFPQLRAAGISGEIEFMGARGSDRVFFRAGDRVAAIYDAERRKENARYAGHAKWLAARGIPVPEIVGDFPEANTLVMEWAGNERKMSLEDYVKVVETLAKFNSLDFSGIELEPEFDADLYRWERELFAEHCLKSRYCMELPEAAGRDLDKAVEALLKEPPALVHRDFQSTNVLWKNGKLRFIDFQGMRKGPAAYDLASLVYDPYVVFGEGERRALVAVYAKASGRADIAGAVPYAAVERLVQCLGAYGRLASVGQRGFCKYFRPALENLLSAANDAGLGAMAHLARELLEKEGPGERCSCGHHHSGRK
ncbi:MAG: phosphotransferase [Kiritimatiellae bacterium]|nr:phosphotransferase [Kiritimatiellia bacterium]